MRYLSNSPYIKVDGQIWSVNVGSQGQYKICPKHIKSIIREVNTMCTLYRRVCAVTFNLHMPEYTPDNKVMSLFEEKLFPLIKRRYKIKDIGFSWVREIETVKHQHYHMALLLNGRQIRNPNKLLDLIQEKWMLAGGGHVHTPNHCYYFIVHSDFSVKQQLIYRLSYQAKERGKGYRGQQAKDYSTSRLYGKYLIKPDKA